MKDYIFFNGRIMHSTEPCISATDRGFLLGDGVFETLRSYEGFLPYCDLHIKRLKDAMKRLGFYIKGGPFSDIDDTEEKIKGLLLKNESKNAYIRVTVSRGSMQPGLLPQWNKGKPNCLIITQALPAELDARRQKGITAIIALIRKNRSSPSAYLKTVNYIDMILARREAYLKEALEAILLDEEGHLAEAATANLFWVKRGILFTPSTDLPILPGITRAKILELADSLGIPYKEGKYVPRELFESNEAFITNSLYEVVPLLSVDRRIIADGVPGDITRVLQAEYRESIKKLISCKKGQRDL